MGWLITPHSTLKWEVCVCKYIYVSMYIYLVKQCVQKIKEGTDKLKLMIEVKMTVIIPESYRCVLREEEGETGGLCGGRRGGGGGGGGGAGGSATIRDTLSFKLEESWVRGVKWV